MKREGLGWARCCPPRGGKADVHAALIKHVRAETSPYRAPPRPPTMAKSLFKSVGQWVVDSSDGLAVMVGFFAVGCVPILWACS